ncbi:MAG: LiaF transmembrane domain-containing protein [Anaerorhabdus sp.]
MKNKKILGLSLVGLAVLILLKGFGFIDFEITNIIMGIISLIVIMSGIAEKKWGKIFFGLAFLFWIYGNKIYNISSFYLFMAALLLTVGFNMIFKNDKKSKFVSIVLDDDEKEETFTHSDNQSNFKLETNVGSRTHYINSKNLESISCNANVGSITIYLDQAELKNGTLNINLEINLGSVVLYIPKEWSVYDDVESTLGKVSSVGGFSTNSENTVRIYGDVSLGNLEIISI